MAYYLEILERDRAYLADQNLSDRSRAAVEAFLLGNIPSGEDGFRLDPDNRHPSGGTCFGMGFVFVDWWGDRRGHTLLCWVSDAAAAHGVLSLLYVELEP